MTLKTWSFSKKHNSTSQPAGSSRDYTVYMKENTSIENPVFILGSGINADINYCQWSGNYYFIDDIELLSKDQVALHCSLDVLATHKTAIGGYTCHIARCASPTYYDSMMYDSAVSQSQEIISEKSQNTAMFASGYISGDGTYVLKVVGAYGSNTAGIAMYVLTKDELEEALDFMFTESNYTDVLTDSLVKSFFNPFQYIVGLYWFPFTKSAYGTFDTGAIKFGWWATNKTTYSILTQQTINGGGNVTIPALYFNDFRSYHNGFTQMSLSLPSVGVINLDPSLLSRTGMNLQVGITVDLATGNTLVNLWRADLTQSDLLASYHGKMGCSIPIGQVNGEAGTLVSSAAQVGIGVATKDTAAGVSGLMGVIGAYNPPASVVGNYGGRESAVYQSLAILSMRTYRSGELLTAIYGRPCHKNLQINLLSGFVQCQGASIALAAPDTEIDKVNNYLNGGFYYE